MLSCQLKRLTMQFQLAITLQFVILSPWWFAVVQSQQDFLQESPEFLKPCPIKDMTNNTCIASSIESLMLNWAGGIPGLSSLSALDPFRLGKLRVTQSVPPNLDVKVELRNMTTYGLGQAKVLNSTTLQKGDFYTLGLHFQFAKINITTKYRLKGRALVLNLNSSGTFDSELDHLEFIVALKLKPQQREGLTFMNLTAVRTKVVRIDKIQVHFTNLFNGNRELEDSANELFNSNWRILYELMRPVLTQTFDNVLQDRFGKMLNYIPAKFLFEGFA